MLSGLALNPGSLISTFGNTTQEVTSKAYHWFVPAKKPTPTFLESAHALLQRVWVSVCRAMYCVVDAAERIRKSSDGLDKTLKLLVGISVGMMLLPFTNDSYWKWLSKELKYVDGVFSAVSVFGRYNSLTRIDDKGQREIYAGGPIKSGSVCLLTVAKTCEFGRLMQTVGLLSTSYLAAFDAQYLGSVVSTIGGHSVLGRMAFEAGLSGCKNFFLVLASTYGIINSMITVIDYKSSNGSYFDVWRASASVGADIGKIYLCTAAFAVSGVWVAWAIATALFSLTKILMDSYKESNEIKALDYPKWMNWAAKV